MKDRITKYHLEIFTAFVFLLTAADALLFRRLSAGRRIINLFMLLAVLHEWEEKRYPGGFYDLMIQKLHASFSREALERAGCIVIAYWLLITLVPFVFDRVAALLLIPVALNFFEAFIHTAGIFIHHTKKPYTPGMLSAWMMGISSAAVVAFLERNALVTASDYVVGTSLMIGSFLLMDVLIIRSAGMTFSDIRQRISEARRK